MVARVRERGETGTAPRACESRALLTEQEARSDEGQATETEAGPGFLKSVGKKWVQAQRPAEPVPIFSERSKGVRDAA